MKRKALLTLFFALAALPAAAQDLGGVFGSPIAVVAQMSREERRALRERWEEATPEERAQMRRTFQERLRMNVQEQYDPRAMEMRQGRSGRDRADSGTPAVPGYTNGFGMGYEQRRFDSRYPDDDEAAGGGPGGGHERRGGGRR